MGLMGCMVGARQLKLVCGMHCSQGKGVAQWPLFGMKERVWALAVLKNKRQCRRGLVVEAVRNRWAVLQ